MKDRRGVIGVAVGIWCVAVALVPFSTRAEADDALEGGFKAPLSGTFAQAGQDMLAGLKLAFEQIGSQAGGRKIELIAEDEEGNPAKALAKYRKLVSQDHVNVLAGVLLS